MVSEADGRKLTGWLLMSLGVLAVVVGATWTLQGLDVLTDSRMSGNPLWAKVGPAVAGVGVLLAVLGIWRRSRAKRQSTTE